MKLSEAVELAKMIGKKSIVIKQGQNYGEVDCYMTKEVKGRVGYAAMIWTFHLTDDKGIPVMPQAPEMQGLGFIHEDETRFKRVDDAEITRLGLWHDPK